jgi:hypothetical protein
MLSADKNQVKTGYGQVDWLTESDLMQGMVATCSTDNNSELLSDVQCKSIPL